MQTSPTATGGKKRSGVKSSLVLMFTSVIWGLAFVAQRSGMEFIGPFMFIAIRMFLGALTLVLTLRLMSLFWQRQRRKQTVVIKKRLSAVDNRKKQKALLAAGVICGVVLFLGASFQQVGLVFTTASKAGFLTTMYLVLVPILGLAIKHKTHWNTWVSVGIAAVGLYFLCVTESLSIELGDGFILVGALFWAVHILVIDHFVAGISRHDVLRVCAWQFAVAAVLALITAPLLDGLFTHGAFNLDALLKAMPAILYVGVLSTGIGFTLQAIGQQGLSPSAASIIMSLESVFALVFGIFLLGEALTFKEVLGCILMFGAVILSQIPVKSKTLPA